MTDHLDAFTFACLLGALVLLGRAIFRPWDKHVVRPPSRGRLVAWGGSIWRSR